MTSIGTALAIYFVLWWVVLFAILPFGVRSQDEQGQRAPGTDPGAPVKPQMLRKLVWTTLISALIYAVAAFAHAAGYLGIERVSQLFGLPL